jgi:protein TonB
MKDGRQKVAASIAVAPAQISWAADAARDRLSSTLFLAGIFHGIVILGVTFSGDVQTTDPAATTSLEVVLVTNTDKAKTVQDEAKLLAQQNTIGVGNTAESMLLKTALGPTLEDGVIGPEQLGVAEQLQQGVNRPSELVVVAMSVNDRSGIPKDQGDNRSLAEPLQKTLPGTKRAAEIINEPETETLVSDSQPRELVISANTREARIAAYLNTWKSRIERVGTLNYPQVARKSLRPLIHSPNF